jgi:Fic family protein
METVSVDWHGMRVEATAPTAIAGWQPELTTATVRRTEQAAAAVVHSGIHATGHLEAVARLLLRAEGLASSAIEGLRASAADVAVAEAIAADDRASGEAADTVAAWVADNLAVVTDALATPGPLTDELLFTWHRRLMRNSPTIEPHLVGAYRDTLGWVGGPNPRLAAHVAAPAELIAPTMRDLLAFAARDDLDPVTQAAVLHAQFETIHPFADGNGRLGRVLIGRLLTQRLQVAVPPPVSLQMARDVGGYQSGLTLYRQGDVDRWVAWFADAVATAADSAAVVLGAVDALLDRWRSLLANLRADAAANTILEALPTHPVVSTATAATIADVSRRAASTAITELARRGILVDSAKVASGRGRPERWWVASDLLALLGR